MSLFCKIFHVVYSVLLWKKKVCNPELWIEAMSHSWNEEKSGKSARLFNDRCCLHSKITSSQLRSTCRSVTQQNIKIHNLRLVHVVRDFRPWEVMMKIRYFFMLHFQFSGPWDAHRVKIQVDQGLWQVCRPNFRTVKRLKTFAIFRWCYWQKMNLLVALLRQIYGLS